MFPITSRVGFLWKSAMAIEIKIRDPKLADEIEKSAPYGISIERDSMFTRSIDVGEIVILTLTFIRDKVPDLELALFASWLYEISQQKSCHVSKGGKQVPKTQDGVRRWIQEELDIRDDKQGGNQDN
jgi:hypothetical protein